MLQGKTFICLGNNMWESNFTNTLVELMTIFSKENKVLYVDYEYTLKDVWETINGRKNAPVKRMLGVAPRLRKVTTRLDTEVNVLTPPVVLPLNKIKSHDLFLKLLRINSTLVESSIRYAMRQLKIEEPIFISGFNPYYGSMLCRKFGESLNIYYCYDEIDSGWHQAHGPLIEDDYMCKTDLVVTTSEYLFSKKSLKASHCHLIKNGVDFHAFNRYAFQKTSGKKTIGYTGSVDGRFDMETVAHLITHHPDHDFIFAGRVTNQHAYKKLQEFPNVKLLGSRRPEEVPAIVGQIDLGIVPYIKNALTKGVYPLKFNEYLAAGKPVVSTDFASLPEFSGLVNFASSPETFLEAVRKELSGDSLPKQEARIKFASQNSWIQRAEEFSILIEESLKSKHSHVTA